MSDTHGDRELAVFTLFLAARGIPPDTVQFEKRDKPEPDILLSLPANEQVAFELVELIDQGWARHLNTIPAMQDLLESTYASLPGPTRTAFRDLYGDADIGFTFNEQATRSQRRIALPTIFAAMLDLPPSLTGPALEADPRFSKTLEHIYIGRAPVLRSTGKGPIFHTSGGMSVGDPTVVQVAAKFALASTYKTSAPIELLAYIDRNAQFPEDVWKERLSLFLQGQADIPFRRVWVLDCTAGSVFPAYP